MVTSYDKAIVAVLVPLIVLGLGHFGFAVSDEFSAALTVVLTGILVFAVPNKAPAPSTTVDPTAGG